MESIADRGAVDRPGSGTALHIRLLGPLEVRREGRTVPLPSSRKVRALLAYLTLAPRPLGRSALCDLLWDVPDDPRGELRWTLSRLRHVVDDQGCERVLSQGDEIRLDLSGVFVDALEVSRRMRDGAGGLDRAAAAAANDLFTGELLEGLEMDHCPAFDAWLTAERRRFRAARVALLERLAALAPAEEAELHLQRWLELAPFDRRAHARLLSLLASQERLPEGEAHLEASRRRFEEAGLDAGSLRQAWCDARAARVGGAAGGAVLPSAASAPAKAPARLAPDRPQRASVAVLPFRELAGGLGWGDALARDLITRLAKLRSLLVIAEGSALALGERRVPDQVAGHLLGVDYLVTGTLGVRAGALCFDVRLEDRRTTQLLWGERLDGRRGEALAVLEDLGDRVVAAIAAEIETAERNRAILRPPGSLDAWESHHRALWHMYRFTRDDNEEAQRLFERSASLDPTFSRALAGLSFTRWQKAFQGWGDRPAELAAAKEAADQAVLVDDRDPAAHWAQGRALWLGGEQETAEEELGRAVELSPNFAQGHYALAFVQAQGGDPASAIAAADRSRELSPFDPLLFGMLGAKAIALVRLGRYAEAAQAAARAAARPNAHAHIQALAAYALALAGCAEEARARALAASRLSPGYSLARFRRAFRLDREGDARFEEGARLAGMS